MNFRKLTAFLICAAMAIGVVGLVACSGSSGSSGAAGASSSATIVEESFFKVALPDGWTQSKQYVYNDADGGSVYVAVHNRKADDLLAIELGDSDFVKGDDVKVGSMTYHVAKSDKWDKAYWIADYEDGSIEVTVNRISDTDTVKKFLEGVTFESGAYEKWQKAA